MGGRNKPKLRPFAATELLTFIEQLPPKMAPPTRRVETVRKWAEDGRMLTITEGDSFAIEIGFHPSAIWPHYWDVPSGYVSDPPAA